jgi:uncharacterized protein (TIGR02996 family)
LFWQGTGVTSGLTFCYRTTSSALFIVEQTGMLAVLMSIPTLETHLRTHPDDQASWLVYGDWLLSQDDIRGELIQLEQRRDTMALRSAEEALSFDKKIKKIVTKHQPKWRKIVPDNAVTEWKHGFVLGIQLVWSEDTPNILKDLLQSPESRFLTKLRLRMERDPDEEAWDEETESVPDLVLPVEQLASFDWKRITVLDLAYCGIGTAGIETILSTWQLGELSELDLRFNNLRDQGARLLAQAPIVASLQTLHLQANRIGQSGAEALAQSEHLRALRYLSLHYNELGAAGAKALSESLIVSNLKTLHLYADDVGPKGLKELANSKNLPHQLRRYWSSRL